MRDVLDRKYADYSRPLAGSFALLLVSFFPALSAAAQAAAQSPEVVEARIITRVNEFRARNGLQPLVREDRLSGAAHYFAGYMARKGELDHEADGTTPAARAAQRGYEYCIIAENIAYEYSSRGYTDESLAVSFVQGWIESPTHRKTMLESEVTQTGLGVAGTGKHGEYYAVQMFARPASERIRFRVANRTARTLRYQYRNRSITLQPGHTRTHESCIAGEIRFISTSGAPTIVRPRNGAQFSVSEPLQGTLSVDDLSRGNGRRNR